MSHVTLTLIGLYNYDDHLFDNLTLPASLDKDTFIDNLLLRSGEFTVIYPDPDFMEFAIGAWSRKWQATFNRWVDALAIEYDPLENYDRHEEWIDRKHGASAENRTSNGKTHGATSGSTNSTTTHNVSAYDSSTLQPSFDDVTAGIDGSHSASTIQNTDDVKAHNAENALHEGRTHGNIGVTTSQQMLQSELDLGYWNIYEKMIDLFLTEFVIPIY